MKYYKLKLTVMKKINGGINMLYPQNESDELSLELFKNPTCEYRGTPFWAWNCKLDKALLFKQIDQLKEMGMGGFHIHSRTGMATEYLGEEFMSLVRSCNEKAKDNNMLCWLYDEDRWPSGYGGGLVTKDKKYRNRFLLFTLNSVSNEGLGDIPYNSTGKSILSSDRSFLAKYEVLLKDGYLSHYKKLGENEEPAEGTKVWGAYLVVGGDNPWFNNQAYVNTLDPEAIQRFVEITHEVYYKALGPDFGKSIPAIFTDEPQFTYMESFGFADEEKDICLPFTDDFEKTFEASYGCSLLDALPELFWDLPSKVSLIRYRYHDHLSERFASGFADTIGNWCNDHGIMLTGHLMGEGTLNSQTSFIGEAMRSYRSFGLPGIDMLCDCREVTTAKQAQSAAHQYGCPGVLSELYGVTNWDFDFRNHKLAGDWQAALGVTVRVHHLTWLSMEGEAKRDYPASIGYQSPWYQEYSFIEDHFSRVNTALTRGNPRVKVGVIHPIESYWLHCGPKEQTAMIRQELENNFSNITNWLLYNLVDFDYISESLLPELCDFVGNVELSDIAESSSLINGSRFKVGKMEYDAVLVPGCETLRSSTVKRLDSFVKHGGKVIFLGQIANLVDAEKCDKVSKLASSCTCIPFTKSSVVQAVEAYRDIDIRNEDGARTDNLFYQMRVDGEKIWLFICHVNKPANPDIPVLEKITMKIRGQFTPVIYDTFSGEAKPCNSIAKGDFTIINHEFYQHDSLLLCLEPAKVKMIAVPDKKLDLNHSSDNSSETLADCQEIKINSSVPITLSEPNVFLLDMAEYNFDNSIWQPTDDVLRIDNSFRQKLGYPLRMEALAQPWVNLIVEAFEHTLSLRYYINSSIEVKEPCLALENAENTEIILNGEKIESKIEGWFVDESIKKVSLNSIPVGRSELILKIPFNSKTNVEYCFLLGDFGVKVEGRHARIIEPVRELSFGDWTSQGLPFYAGNVTYHCNVDCEKGNLSIQSTLFRNPLLIVSLDGNKKVVIAFSPYELNLGPVQKGSHNVDITAFGNRVNTFGTIHNCDYTTQWYGPNAWRTTGSSWSYEYQLKPTGIIVAPKVTWRRFS